MARIKSRPVNHARGSIVEVPITKDTLRRLSSDYDDFCESVASAGGKQPDFPNFVAILLKRSLDERSVE